MRARGLSKSFEESNPPAGFMAATSDFASSAVVGDLPRRNTGSSGFQTPSRRGTLLAEQPTEEPPRESAEDKAIDAKDAGVEDGKKGSPIATGATEKGSSHTASDYVGPAAVKLEGDDDTAAKEPFNNGYHFPPKYPQGEAFKHGLMSFLRYSLTLKGFGVVLYGLNVVAWGGMLFLLLCNASPAMCYPDCNDINSPRRVWIEIDSQILTALFSLTAFGLAPWRFRDLWYLMKYRVGHRQEALRCLAGIHQGWFRLPGSASLPVDAGPESVDGLLAEAAIPSETVPLPTKKMPDPPLTGIRAPSTRLWKMDFVIHMMVWNTFFQCVLSGVMWGMNRYTRPSWSTGLFVALGCIVAAVGGIMMFVEGRRVKSIEGVPLSDRDRERLARDKELGILHYNNLKDKPPVKEKEKGKRKGRA